MSDSAFTIFIKQLEALCNKAFGIAHGHREAGRNDGLAYNHFDREVSCLMGVKTLLFGMDRGSASKGFDEAYINNILPSSLPRRDIEIAKNYIREAHTAIRFVLFQNYFSQTEFTYRIIKRLNFDAADRRHPFKLIADEYGVLDYDEEETVKFTDFIRAIRNTIHNNGWYFPDGKNPEDLIYQFANKEFVLSPKTPFRDISMEDILAIVEYIQEQNRLLFINDELAEIELPEG